MHGSLVQGDAVQHCYAEMVRAGRSGIAASWYCFSAKQRSDSHLWPEGVTRSLQPSEPLRNMARGSCWGRTHILARTDRHADTRTHTHRHRIPTHTSKSLQAHAKHAHIGQATYLSKYYIAGINRSQTQSIQKMSAVDEGRANDNLTRQEIGFRNQGMVWMRSPVQDPRL